MHKVRPVDGAELRRLILQRRDQAILHGSREAIGTIDHVLMLLATTATLDYSRVIHAHWTVETSYFDGCVDIMCSYCGEMFTLLGGTPEENQYKYCPNCGAMMDEEVET